MTLSAYCIFQIEITDTTRYQDYVSAVSATVEQYGGRYLVRGGPMEILEGHWSERRLVVLEFPSVEQAKRWYRSPEYAEPRAVRHASAVCDAVLVEGCDP